MIDSGQNRAFHYAILASLALHAFVLFLFPDLLDPTRRAVRFPPPIIARLMEPEPVAPPAAPVEAPPAPPLKKPAAKSARKAAPERAAEPEPVRAPPEPAAPTAEAGASPIAAAEPELAPPSIASVQPGPAPAAPSAEAPESLSRDQYRLQLVDEARRHKRYPSLARENNWQGDVLVAVVVGANGWAAVTLKGSSGYEVLDRQALDMFRQAARVVAVPPTLRGKEFALEVRAVYGFED